MLNNHEKDTSLPVTFSVTFKQSLHAFLDYYFRRINNKIHIMTAQKRKLSSRNFVEKRKLSGRSFVEKRM